MCAIIWNYALMRIIFDLMSNTSTIRIDSEMIKEVKEFLAPLGGTLRDFTEVAISKYLTEMKELRDTIAETEGAEWDKIFAGIGKIAKSFS